ncbi:MAG TPA: alkaline phosphatase family protein [Chitinophagales bacterium]|nr:alkaline phosphatase family protein [Chitinophagales bacterium]HRK26872.1 alkaline phosphatase family protein [Chitinophagales bacterium]
MKTQSAKWSVGRWLPFLVGYCCWVIGGNLAAQNTAKVLILGIDGCRPDALQAANTPHIDQLFEHGVYSYHALTHHPTWSGAGWSSMLTGVWEDKHNVYNNAFTSPNYTQYPHFITRLETLQPQLNTASVVHWAPINNIITTVCDTKFNLSTDLAVKNKVVELLNTTNPDVLFVDFDDVDAAGHANGFLPTIIPYLNAIQVTDGYVGEILTALYNRPTYAAENWLILVSTDHGGIASGHGGPSAEERTIFVLAHKANMPPQPVLPQTTTLPAPPAPVFNGTSQYAAPLSPGSLFQFGAAQDFSVELRVQYTTLSGDAAFISDKNWNSGANKGFVISTPTADITRWKVNVGDGVNRADVTGGVIADGQWHHLSATFDRDGQLRIYQDGKLENLTAMSNVGDINSLLPLTIGQDGTRAYPYWFNGKIAEVRIWNTILAEQTIKDWACAPVNNTHPNYANLLAYWKMDDGSGSTLIDSSPNGITASFLGGTPTWTAASGMVTCYDYTNTPRITDVACTALTHLGIGFLPEWNLDGRSLILPISGGSLPTCYGNTYTYSVPPQGNCNFNWQVTNGSIISGQGTNTVLVQWNSPGAGQIQVSVE